MMFTRIIIGAFLLAGALQARTVEAATLVDIKGDVLVNTGGGFVAARGPTMVAPGHQVFIRPGGAAHIVFDDGCKVPVAHERVVQIGASSPCTPGAEQQRQAAPTGTPTMPGAAGAAEVGGVSSSALVVGGLAIAGGAALAVGLSGGGNKDKPASP